MHAFLAVFTAFLVVAVVVGNAAAHSHALTAGFFALLSLILFEGITARVGLAVCGVIAALLLGYAGKKARALEDDLSRRDRS